MSWRWHAETPEDALHLSLRTMVYEAAVADGRAYVLMGSYATRYDWFVMDLEGLGMAGRVQVTRGGPIRPDLRSSESFRKGDDRVNPGYVEEKFPGATSGEYEEMGAFMIPFLTSILDREPIVRGSPKEWRPRR